ncbi:endothelin-converting enzyme-like 1 [Ixodes scapularis]
MRATEGVQPVLDILRGMGLGDWPYSPGAGLPGAEAIVELGAATYGFPFFLSLRVAPDPRRSRENLVHVDLPEMVLHSNFLLFRDVGGYAALMKAYAAYAVRTLSLLGVHGAPEQVFADVLQYEIAMAEHASHRTLRELTEFKPENIALLARMVRDIYQIADVPISHSEEILVWNMTFVGALDQFFEGEKQRWLLNYLGWRVAEVLGPASSVELLGARHAFLMAKYGADDAPQLAVHCFEEVSRLLPIPMGRMAFRAQADGATFQKLISRMVAEIRASLLLLLEGSDIRWLTDESKAIATEKIRKLKLIQQPYNSTLIDWETPDVLLYGESYVNNLILLQTSKATQEWKGLSRHNSLDTVAVPQLRMSVSYDVYRNAIGSVIDEQGSLRNWHTRARFDILVNCFGTMLRHTITNEIMNRVRSSSVALSQMFNRELIIGSTALPAAFKAFRTFMARYEGESEFSALPRVRFTQNQLFFLYFAKSWCHTKRKTYESYYIEDSNEPPPDLRVNHILMDFEKFGKTFECQLGTDGSAARPFGERRLAAEEAWTWGAARTGPPPPQSRCRLDIHCVERFRFPCKKHIAHLESLRREQNQRCKGRRRANATDGDRATEAKRKRVARRRLHSTPAEQFPGATARFGREFVDYPFGVTCAVCDRIWFAEDVSTIGGVSDEKKRETGACALRQCIEYTAPLVFLLHEIGKAERFYKICHVIS